jgi:small subunit ribosomal protein S13
MPRILGVDLPSDKATHIALRCLHGVGPTTSLHVCEQAGVDPLRKARELAEDEISRLAAILDRQYMVEGVLRRDTRNNIARLCAIRCYRGLRHGRSLPVRGQRTRSNARTRKVQRKGPWTPRTPA